MLKKETKQFLKWIGKHVLFFSVTGVVVLLIAYYFILSKRVELGYFDYPFLTTLSELTWFLLGGVIYLSFNGLKKLFSRKKRNKK